MATADDRYKFGSAIEKTKNTEAAMQSWRKEPFPERRYERLSDDAVCDGLSDVDGRIATYELRTNLPDSFVGISYRYDDTGQSEDWMKSVVNETGASGQSKDEARRAAEALAADDGVTRAQVVATMQTLLIGVQDRVMTERNVLNQSELRSANWGESISGRQRDEKVPANGSAGDMQICLPLPSSADSSHAVSEPTCGISSIPPADEQLETQNTSREPSDSTEPAPEIVEQPVWGMDCYTRRNITSCLLIDFDERTVLKFIEKWLLPAINACPVEFAQDISNAARLLEGLPFVKSFSNAETCDANDESDANWSQTLLGAALRKKIEASAPSWLKGAASELQRARAALGADFFRIHPKGHGSVLLSPTAPANRLVTFYRGELYPSWRWGEKMDAIELTQRRKGLKPALPDFYNMVLERPQTDPRGYGLLFVDASRKAGHGSSLSHSCDPTCEVRVAARNGELCLAMTTLRELEMGEELTFDYHAVTESLNEYQSAVCLCGYGKCRGSFLHFATAECYQQVLNRNAPIATRFSNLVKRSMKQVMSEDDERVLRNHGFHTAAFGAISVNRREGGGSASNRGSTGLLDSIDIVPVWLKTYVADTLRYIEYERRALPISLICDHLSNEEEKKDARSTSITSSKKPGREPTFFYFARVERDYFRSMLRQQGFPESANGLELKHALLKIASAYWKALPEEKKAYWKSRANTEFEKKTQAWQAEQQGEDQSKAVKSKKSGSKNAKSGNSDALLSSKISFQDADAEGVSAMEQRIQQLTQTLSRVGRVLDRHREGALDDGETCADGDVSLLREFVHSPLRVLPDEEVVGWMWNSSNGVVPSLFRELEQSRYTRPSLLQRLSELRKDKYGFLEQFGDPKTSNFSRDSRPTNGAEGRRELNKALLEMRKLILDDLKEMAKDFRRFRCQGKSVQRNLASTKKQAEREATMNEGSQNEVAALEENSEGVIAARRGLSDEEADSISTSTMNSASNSGKGLRSHLYDEPPVAGGIDSAESKLVLHSESRVTKGAGEGCEGTQLINASPESATGELHTTGEDPDDMTEKRLGDGASIHPSKSALSALVEAATECADAPMKSAVAMALTELRQKGSTQSTESSLESQPWLENYGQRFVLHATADALLFYAHTTNFFALRAYRGLESTPVDVYARELGNNVPRSVVDESVAVQEHSEKSGSEFLRDQSPSSSCVGEQSSSMQTLGAVEGPKSGKGSRDEPKEAATDVFSEESMCQPDDIVASVAVRYQGDYVLSQLLQWYNGGIGQKPGLPDLSGCTILPSMEGIWSSWLLESNSSKPEKRTIYETKIRPRLVEWFQDPYQRGNPWPEEIRQAFEHTGDELSRLEDSSTEYFLFGSPITDFLIEGDESNIYRILKELDADDKVSSKKNPNGLLSSLDRGRPAQAVSTWVQCEDCLKWRKIPWQVDVDLLPDKFYCRDNVWNTAASSCDAPEDEWDNEDPLVDANGKVESSPIRRRKAGSLSPLDEKNFKVGGTSSLFVNPYLLYLPAGQLTKVSPFTQFVLTYFVKAKRLFAQGL